jgi:tRNA pseudouridine38-40 synthase
MLTSTYARVAFRPVTSPQEEPDRRIRLTLHYDGGGFHGWQFQPAARSVQAELETVLTRLTARATRVAGAGRTDAGVHALGQVASVDVPARWKAEELMRALNALLPPDIWVAAAAETDPDFHARFSATARGYIYRVGTAPHARSPFLRRWCWPLAQRLELEALNGAAALLSGDHSFRSFAKSGQPERGDRCRVHLSRWRAWGGHGVEYAVVANRFLHHMVRYMVGTMVAVARGERPESEIAALLEGRAGLETSPPAPAEGLYFCRVFYPGDDIEGEELTDEILS